MWDVAAKGETSPMEAPIAAIVAGPSSFGLDPSETLDPELFDGMHLSTGVRLDLLGRLYAFMTPRYRNHERWLRSWLAGSGVSYRWDASETGKDLDVLLGIDWVAFRQANPGFSGVGDAEIASHINDQLRAALWPTTSTWHDRYEVTWYVNPRSWDIRAINPYAAYSLTDDAWTVRPDGSVHDVNPEWDAVADAYSLRAAYAVQRYSQALTEIQGAQNPSHRINAEGRFRMAVDQASSLYDTVHEGRRTAFSPVGGGYSDFANYLWQSGKKAGWIPALRSIKEYRDAAASEHQVQTYGVELPTAEVLVRRAAMIGMGL